MWWWRVTLIKYMCYGLKHGLFPPKLALKFDCHWGSVERWGLMAGVWVTGRSPHEWMSATLTGMGWLCPVFSLFSFLCILVYPFSFPMSWRSTRPSQNSATWFLNFPASRTVTKIKLYSLQITQSRALWYCNRKWSKTTSYWYFLIWYRKSAW